MSKLINEPLLTILQTTEIVISFPYFVSVKDNFIKIKID